MENNKMLAIKEKEIFPEIKQNLKNVPQVKLYKYSEIEGNLSNFHKITEEKYKKGNLVYESQWIKNNDIDKMESVVIKIKEYREGKNKKKKDIFERYKNDKEKKFNKIYDKNFYPKSKRKEAYKHFVLNPDMYPKNIKKSTIESFINEKSTIETKSFIKILKKSLKENYAQDESWILDDFTFKKRIKVYLKDVGFEFNRAIEIIYLQKNEIKKIKNKFKNHSIEEIVDFFYNLRASEAIKKEEEYVKKTFHYINAVIDFDSSNKDYWVNSFRKAIKKYNKEEALEEFLVYYFSHMNHSKNIFSERQKKLFELRRKFRVKLNVNYQQSDFTLPFFVSFEKHIKDLVIQSSEDYEKIFRKLTDRLDDWTGAMTAKYQLILDKGITSALKEIIEYSERNYDFKRLSVLSDRELKDIFIADFANEFSKVINGSRDYLKKDFSLKDIEIIKEGIFEELKGIVKNYLIKEIVKIDYKESFPLARQHKRKIKFFMGETNSGKTYNAFNELVKAKSGIYLSPLRLLALEGQDEIEKRGKACSMLTGEERDIKPDANFKSCTIEMLDPTEFVESIVIDEIQMLKDPNRGWAWVQALVGSPAENIILAGSPEILEMVKKIVEYTGDELIIEEYKRKSPLVMMSDPIDLESIPKSTAIIAFSRRKVLELKEKLADRSVSVIYGNLGPEVRKEEARKFREGETEILIATDAIAMGLNLPIEYIIFSTHEKTIRQEKVELDEQLVKQIAGRAGRYGIKNKGYVGALNGATLKYVKEHVENKIQSFEDTLPIMPNIEYLNKIKAIIKTDKLAKILSAFNKYADFHSELFYCTDLSKRIELSEVIQDYGFSLSEGFSLSSAPVRENYEGGIDLFEKYIKLLFDSFYADRDIIVGSPPIDKFIKKDRARSQKVLQEAEETMHGLELYAWFANRYDEIFVDIAGVEEKRIIMNNFIINTLKYK